MAVDKNTVARWAASLTLGQSTLISDTFNTTKFFAKAPLRIHYAATFNNATASQIHHLTDFNWICCVQPENLVGIATGAALVILVEAHLTDQLSTAAPDTFRTGAGVADEGPEAPQGAGAAADASPAESASAGGSGLPLADGGGE